MQKQALLLVDVCSIKSVWVPQTLFVPTARQRALTGIYSYLARFDIARNLGKISLGDLTDICIQHQQ